MTPEQMREAAAKLANDMADCFRAGSQIHLNYGYIADQIRAIPITPPEPTMRDWIAGALFADTGNLCSRHTANKVLEAMRNPTQAMIQGAYRDCPCSSDFIRMWQAAIDAARAER